MERDQFDAFTRLVATTGSRRALFAAVLGTVALAPSAFAKRKRRGKKDKRVRREKRAKGGKPDTPPRQGEPFVVNDDCPSEVELCCNRRCIVMDHDHCGSCTRRCAPSEFCQVAEDGTATCVFCDVCNRGQPLCPYKLVSESVSDPNGPATIHICPGIYRDRVRIDKDVTLIGVGERFTVTLDGRGQLARAAVLTV